ncbi:EAL domain-containing protein [Rhodoferax saidenbachensis]|nr:EAL domain-containing protein [Rhodoferax saidenbachensis]
MKPSMTHFASFEVKVLVAFGAAMLVVTSLATTTWRMSKDEEEASRLVAHTHAVLDGLARTRVATLQIEYATQSYRISGDPARIAERNTAIAEREVLLGKLKALTSNNPNQEARWDQLRGVLNQRLALSRKIEELRKTEGSAAANAFVATAPLQQTREAVYQILDAMDEEEHRLLQQRTAGQLQARKTLVVAGAVVSGLLLLLLTGTYAVIRRQVRATAASQRALAESEENLSITLYSIGDAVMATDAHARITRMNPVAETLTGWAMADALGHSVDEVFNIINEFTRRPAVVPVAQALETGETQELEQHTVLIARDGSERPISDSAAPIRNATGTVTGVVLVFRDVTAARQAEHTIRQQNELLEQRVAQRTEQLRDSEDHLRSVINNLPALIAYVDADQRYVYANAQYHGRFAPERAEITGCTVREILGDALYTTVAPMIADVLQGNPRSYDWQPFPDAWQLVSYVPKRTAQNQVLGYYVLISDITERKHAEEKIQTLNTELEHHIHTLERTGRALKTLSAGNRSMLRAADEQDLLDSMCRAIVDAGSYPAVAVWYKNNDASQSLTPMAGEGYPAGLSALNQLKVTWADNEKGQGAVAKAIRTGQTQAVTNMLADASYHQWRDSLHGIACVVACPVQVGGEVIGTLAIYGAEPDAISLDEQALLTELADDLAFGISTLRTRQAQRETQEAMHRLTRYDKLTSLPNETQFSDFLTAAIESGRQFNQAFALLQVNIDRLNEINDALGFSHGDQLLRAFSARLVATVPDTALVARLRGDEFAILLPDSHAEAALAIVQQVGAVLAQPFPIADIPLDVSARIGVAFFPEHGATPHDLYRHVDSAVNQAKRQGISHVIFDPAQSQEQSRRLSVASELRRAIENGDLLLYLQPKVEVASGKVCGAEGLVRWKHAERGLIPPSEFISLAEHTGLIKPLTEWVIETGLRLNHAWQRQGCALPIALNLSARNLRDENLLEKIRQLRATWSAGAGLLELEITESSVMDDPEFALQVLHSLRNEGIPLYVDDFGTGYSSLAYLQKMPVDYIKIDQSFVRSMSTSKDSALIVRSTIDLVHDLGRKAVAEGVETQGDWDQLAALGCDFIQGYFIAKPMPSQDLPAWIAQYQPPITGLPQSPIRV